VGEIGNLFGGLFPNAYPQSALQNQWATSTANATNWSTTIDYSVKGDLYGAAAPVKETGPESALAWLDRRVAEVCVKL